MSAKIINLLLIVYFCLYLTVCLLFKGSGYTDGFYVLISVCTFLYGIFVAFSIYNHQTRLSQIKELLRTDDSSLLLIYRQSIVFGEDIQNKIRSLIDAYLMIQIDYKLADDFYISGDASQAFYCLRNSLKPRSYFRKLTSVFRRWH